VNTKLSFAEEIGCRVKKANSIVGIIRRSFTYLDDHTFVLLFKALVRPHLEYAGSVWQPHLRRDFDRLEGVQRRATKMLPRMKDLTYSERLQRLNLPSLAFRRLRGDMVEVYKILHQLYDINPEEFFKRSENNTRGHSLKLLVPTISTNIRRNGFSFRTVSTWNSLPEETVQVPSLNAFKNRLDKLWRNHHLMYLTE
jgi:hypothetical protein